MINSPDTTFAPALAAHKKAELHAHLEGTITPPILELLAAKNRIVLTDPVPLPSGIALAPGAALLRYLAGKPSFENFTEFIGLYLKVSQCVFDEDDILMVAEEYLRSAQKQQIVYSEMYFSPSTFALLGRDLLPLFRGLARVQELAETKYGSRLRWIFDVVRNTSQNGFEVLEFAESARSLGVDVAALGIAGDELAAPASKFAEVFRSAKKRGFTLLAHTGESGGADQIRETIDHLQPARIGHGINMLEDPKLVELIVERQIPVEVSPWSNIKLAFCSELQHPIIEMLERGVRVIIASDDPGLFGKTLLENYQWAASQGVTVARLQAMADDSLVCVSG